MSNARPHETCPNQGFECSEYFHLAQANKAAILIYGLAFRITKLGKRSFFPSASTIAKYFNLSECQIRRGLRRLEQIGFFVLEDAAKFRPNVYRVLSHEDWQKLHPGECCAKETSLSQGKGDPLGIALWAITGGRVKFKQFQIDSFLRLDPSNEKIISEFQKFWDETGRNLDTRNVSPYFYKTLEHNVRG